jgi:hypothetical protein
MQSELYIACVFFLLDYEAYHLEGGLNK